MTTTIQIEREPEKKYPDYLRDESRKTGWAESIFFPGSSEELTDYIKSVSAKGETITIQGARTGIAGGAVPEGGNIVNLSRMNRILQIREDKSAGKAFVAVEPALLLQDLREAVASHQFTKPYFFSPDPTETTASIGGMAATDASGAVSFLYGPTRNSISRLEVVLADGDILKLERGRNLAKGRSFRLQTEAGRSIEGELPFCEMPKVKNAAGYFVHPGMDMIDLFIGSEGTLGIISGVELILVPSPAAVWGIMMFLPTLDSAVNFVEKARGKAEGIAALELFDDRSLDLLRDRKKANAGFEDLPEIPAKWKVAIYAEFHGKDIETVEESVMSITEILIEEGGSEEDTWLASDEREMQKLKDFRHAVPEAVNSLVDQYRKNQPELTKLGTDLAVPDAAFTKVCSMYASDLKESGLDYVIFGHAGDNHLHVNIIPSTITEYESGKKLYHKWAKQVVSMGGTVSAEHGIGKLKRDMLKIMYGDEIIEQMKYLKETFDPGWQLNPGDLFEAPVKNGSGECNEKCRSDRTGRDGTAGSTGTFN